MLIIYILESPICSSNISGFRSNSYSSSLSLWTCVTSLSRMKRARDSSSSRVSPSLEAGIIKKLRLENFMCHSNHETEFGNHVNVITGQNGSMCYFPSFIAFTLPLYLFILVFDVRGNVVLMYINFGKFMYLATRTWFL